MNIRIEKDKKKRINFSKKELKNKSLKFIYINEYLNNDIRFLAKIMLHSTTMNNSNTSIRNSCILTGRKNSVFKKYKVSRIQLKKMILNGLIPGFVKSN